jgi:ubiquinone/menaquinone biosynthesis C-methylase UbiE
MPDVLGTLYDSIAMDYERVRVPRFRPFVKRLLQLYDTRPGSWVLDAGCGTGLVATMVAPRAGHGGKVIGIDSSAAMLEIARAKARGFGFDQCEFRVGDVRALDFPDDTFDLVVCSFALWGEPAQLFREFRRVLKKGGVLLLQNWSFENDAVLDAYNDVFPKYRSSQPDAALEEMRAARRAYQSEWDVLREPNDYAEAVRAAGFAQARGEWITLPMQFANTKELLEYLNLGVWRSAELSAMDADTRAKFSAEALQTLESFSKDGKVVMEKRAVQVAARK